jgi:hypothetical protein
MIVAAELLATDTVDKVGKITRVVLAERSLEKTS